MTKGNFEMYDYKSLQNDIELANKKDTKKSVYGLRSVMSLKKQ